MQFAILSNVNCSVENHGSVDGRLHDRSRCTDCERLDQRLDLISRTNAIKQILMLSHFGVSALIDNSGYVNESVVVSRSVLQLLTNSMINEAFPATSSIKIGLMKILLFLDIIVVIAGSQIADHFHSIDFILLLVLSGILNLVIHCLVNDSISFERNRIRWIHNNKSI